MRTKIAPGTRLGPYEIQSLIGSGGMGEVYRARDDRLHRDVAVKVIPEAFAGDSDRLLRFEQEARATGQLNHPNIVAIYDVGTGAGGASDAGNGDLPYIVTELLEGQTLRESLAHGPIPPRRAIEYATQIAAGLSAAHSKGIAHRDLKPENLFIVKGGHLKILDFGLAKLLRPSGIPADHKTASIQASLTMTGTIMGTASYMAPEQIREQPTDHRADIFSLGAILYEMLTAKRAFDGETPMDRMTAILHSEPPELPASIEDALPGIGKVIRAALDKRAEDRFDSARDMSFALSLVTERTGARPDASPTAASTAAGGETAIVSPQRLSYRRITFRDGAIHGARFAPDGKAVCYAASWEGNPLELFWSYPGNPEARALGFPTADLLSIAPTGEMAVSLRWKSRGGFIYTGMLARMPSGGGAPKEIMDGVWEAEFSPDGRRLAIVRDEGGMTRIEFPAGTVLYQTPGWVNSVRVSPDGTRFAFLDHPTRGNDAGSVVLVDLDRNVKQLSRGWSSERGLAWSPDGREVVFAAAADAGRGLHAVSLDGAERQVLQIPGNMTLADISHQGAVLVLLEHERMRARFMGAGDAGTRDLTWLDWTRLCSITSDGTRILFDETGVGGGELGSAYFRGTDGSPAIRLGDGMAYNFSPDAQWALTGVGVSPARLDLVPCGAGEPRMLPTGDLKVDHASWFPDGHTICCLAREPGHGMRLFKFDIETGKYVAFSEEGITNYDVLVSPDGHSVAAHGPDRKLAIYPVDGGAPKPLKGVLEYERPSRWSAEGDAIFVFTRGEVPARVWRIDLETGERKLWREISPPDRTGVEGIATVRMTADAASFAYSYYQRLSGLYVVEGLF